MRNRIVASMGKKPTVRPVRQISIPWNAEQTAGIERFRAREGLSTATEAIRVLVWRQLMAEGLVTVPDTAEPSDE